MSTLYRVAIIGAGPAGIYAGNILTQRAGAHRLIVDVFDALPAPFGLIRYGVAPDHPRIKGIVNSLHDMLDGGAMRFIGNVTFGTDVTLGEMREHYDAIIFATGAARDASLDIPGVDLVGSYGAADFVAWYDGHPDSPETWPLDATDVAVIGNGNVALDVARILAKHPSGLLSTDIPATVHAGLVGSTVTDVHVFGRRGPAQVKFTPLELRELGEIDDVDIVVYEEDFADEQNLDQAVAGNNQAKVMMRTLLGWLTKPQTGASRRLHLHFYHQPTEIIGDDRVEGVRFTRTVVAETGAAVPTDVVRDHAVQAVYRAVGYIGSPLAEVPFNEALGVIPNSAGRILDHRGDPIPGLYATGWIKRGAVGLIGHTKSDALETITHLLGDLPTFHTPLPLGESDILDLFDERGIAYTTWAGWLELDRHEREAGAADASGTPRERVKVVSRDHMVRISRSLLQPTL